MTLLGCMTFLHITTLFSCPLLFPNVFGEVSVQIFQLFFLIELFSYYFEESLYIQDISPMTDI